MAVQHDGGGSGFPPLPADAGPTERALYEIYDFQTGIVSYTASQWKTTADEITDLASSVRQVVRELRRAPDGGEAWSGTAAEAAYDSLGKLATNLDRHAEDILNIEAGLTAASDAVSDARTAYVTRVRTVDTDIDQTGYMTGPPPPPVGPPVPKTLDTAAYDQAVSAARAQRESEAQSVMQTYDTRMETAAKKLPVEPAESPVSDGNYPSGPGGPGGYPGGSSGGGGGGYTPPNPIWDDLPPTGDGDGGDDDDDDGNPTIWEPPTGNPDDEICSGFPEVSVDAPTETGGLTPGSGVPTPSTGTTTPGGVPTGGIGGAGAAMGMGGMVAGGGAAALFGRGGAAGLGLGSGRPGGTGASGRPGVVGVGSTGGAASRDTGGTAGRGGTGAGGTGRTTVIAGGGGQRAAGRGTGGRGGAGGRGAGRTGRFGVPQLGEKGGRGGAVGAAGTAGSRGGRRKDERDGQDVDHLTHEDEETWFEGSDDASPPVWE